MLYLCFKSMVYAQGTLTFDDLSLPFYGQTEPVPNGYGALQWVNFYAVNPANSFQGPSGSGFQNAVVSSDNVIWNGGGNPAGISSSSLFNLYSAYLTADWMNGLQLDVQGYTGNVLTYDEVYTINTTAPTLLAFDYLGVNQVTFTASGGTPVYTSSGSEFAIDNMTVAVPEPSAVSLLLITGAGIGFFRSISRRSA